MISMQSPRLEHLSLNVDLPSMPRASADMLANASMPMVDTSAIELANAKLLALAPHIITPFLVAAVLIYGLKKSFGIK